MSQTTGAAGTAANPEDERREQMITQIRGRLESDLARLREQVHGSQSELDGLLRDAGETGGRDEGDVSTGFSTLEREAGSSSNALALLEQTALALSRIEAGSYGSCQACGGPISLARLDAAPRATTCLPCRHRLERQR